MNFFLRGGGEKKKELANLEITLLSKKNKNALKMFYSHSSRTLKAL